MRNTTSSNLEEHKPVATKIKHEKKKEKGKRKVVLMVMVDSYIFHYRHFPTRIYSSNFCYKNWETESSGACGRKSKNWEYM